jgi:hypothetical protein
LNFSASQLAAFSGLFSSAVVRDLATKNRSARFIRLAKETGLLDRAGRTDRVRDLFDSAFDVLKRVGLRDEYIYKAALTHRVLLGKHNLKTACMLTEFRVGECKADLSILNGTMTVFEIKSERDTLVRLERQLRNYKRVFASSFVIVGENHVGAVLKETPHDVGVLSLSRRYQISTVRDATDRPDRICPATVFDSLRIAEAKEILIRLGHEIPVLPNTEIHAALRRMFSLLRPEEVHTSMLATLKKSRSLLPLATLVDRLPMSLQPAALCVPLRKADRERLIAAVDISLRQAAGWA